MTVVSKYVGTVPYISNTSNYTFTSTTNAIGAPNGVYAGYRSGSNIVNSGTMEFRGFGFAIPAGSTINSVTCAHTGYLGTATAGGAKFSFYAVDRFGTLIGATGIIISVPGSGTQTFTAPGTYTPEILNNLAVLWQAPGRVPAGEVGYAYTDSFQVTVDYTEPPAGPVMKRLDATGTWVNTTIRKRFDGTNWVDITNITKL